jgi:parallel beta-helix repeat protein
MDRRSLIARIIGLIYLSFSNDSAAQIERAKPDIVAGYIRLEDFGAVGDGIVDDTAAIQSALNFASNKNLSVSCDAGRIFSVSTLLVRHGVASLDLKNSTIKGNGVAKDAVIVLGTIGRPMTGASLSVRIDMSNGDRVALKGYDTKDCIISNCEIFGFTNNLKSNHYGILLIGSAARNKITGNRIRGVDNPSQRGLLIDLLGGGQSDYGGFFEGASIRAKFPCVENIIENNILEKGSYAVNLLGSERNLIRGNICTEQNHRCIYLANTSSHNIIESNQLINYLSSAIVFGYASSANIARKNIINRALPYASGEAAINVNTGAGGNTITDNSIQAATNYGVYLACDVVGNVVSNNTIENFYLAGVAIENDWKSPRPSKAIYSRPNYGTPPYGVYSHVGARDNVVTSNIFGAGYPGRKTAAIAVSQIDAGNGTKVTGTVIQNNQVRSSVNMAYNVYFYSDSDSGLINTTITGNKFHENNRSVFVNSKGENSWIGRLEKYGDNVNFNPNL